MVSPGVAPAPVMLGVLSLVMLSVLETPVSDAAVKSGVCGTAGVAVSTPYFTMKVVTGEYARNATTNDVPNEREDIVRMPPRFTWLGVPVAHALSGLSAQRSDPVEEYIATKRSSVQDEVDGDSRYSDAEGSKSMVPRYRPAANTDPSDATEMVSTTDRFWVVPDGWDFNDRPACQR